MVVGVTLYKNTGLGVGNCYEDSSLLDLFATDFIQAPEIAVKQTRGLTHIRIGMTWEQICEVDYCKIADQCYWVTSIYMLNDNVAELGIVYDPITSIGIDNIEIIDGWCTRRTLAYDEDELFKYTALEPFSPNNPYESHGQKIMPDVLELSDTDVILSTVDLSNEDTVEKYQADFYIAQEVGESTVGCAVPKLNKLTTYTNYVLSDPDNVGPAYVNAVSRVAGTALFDVSNETVQANLLGAISIGAINSILDSYSLPDYYFNITKNDNGLITGVEQKVQSFTSAITDYIQNYEQYYVNKKVFSGQFLKAILVSPSSGNSQTYDCEDIVPENREVDQILYYIIPDARFNGKPVCVPLNYMKHTNAAGLFMGSVNGSEWQRAPFTSQATGSGTQLVQFNTGRYTKDIQAAMNAVVPAVNSGWGLAGANYNYQNATMMPGDDNEALLGQARVGQLKSGLGLGSNILGGLTNLALYGQQRNAQSNILHAQQSALEMHFMNNPSAVSYFGNIFFELISGLSDTDMKTFDIFLTAFGYALNEQLKKEFFTKNPTFDFVQAERVLVKGNFTSDVRTSIIEAISNGVRIWHKVVQPIKADTNHTLIVSKEANYVAK